MNNNLRFGTSGIRGLFQEEIDTNMVMKLIESISLSDLGSKFLVGHDSRRSCILFANILTSGLSYHGNKVNQIGFAPTPLVAYATKKGDFDLGFSVTASHNPPNYCGIKIFDPNGIAIDEETEQMLQNYSSEYKFHPDKFGRITFDEGIKVDYSLDIMKRFDSGKKKFKILVDCANGVTNDFTPLLLSKMGHEVISINSHPSHLFHGHSPEPIKENLSVTTNLVKNSDVDFAFVHDGDGDRLVIITKEGIVPDYVFSYLLLSIIIQERKGNVVISINSSTALEDLAQSHSCNASRARLGKTFITLDKLSGIYATEPSKVIDSDWGMWEDGMYAAIKLVNHMSVNNLDMQDMIDDVPKKSYLQNNIAMDAFDADLLKEKVLKTLGEPVEIQEIDGLRLIYSDSWVLFRASGTEPKCRIYVESNSEERSADLMKKAESVLLN